MDKPTKLLIAGLALGGAIAAGGFINTHRLQAKLEELRTACIAEGEKEAAVSGSNAALAAKYGGKLLCDPIELSRSNSSSERPGPQEQLVKTQHELRGSEQLPIFVGAAIALLLAVPWTWYFLLRRLKEIREAITGK